MNDTQQCAVRKLLASWSIEEMTQHLKDNGLGLEELKMMTLNHMNELLKPYSLGMRVRFHYNFEKWRRSINNPLNTEKNGTFNANIVVDPAQLSKCFASVETQTEKSVSTSSTTMTENTTTKSQGTQTPQIKVNLLSSVPKYIMAKQTPRLLKPMPQSTPISNASTTFSTSSSFMPQVPIFSTTSTCASTMPQQRTITLPISLQPNSSNIFSTSATASTPIQQQSPISSPYNGGSMLSKLQLSMPSAISVTSTTAARPVVNTTSQATNNFLHYMPTTTAVKTLHVTPFTAPTTTVTSTSTQQTAINNAATSAAAAVADSRLRARSNTINIAHPLNIQHVSLPKWKATTARSVQNDVAAATKTKNDDPSDVSIMTILHASGERGLKLINSFNKNKRFTDEERSDLINLAAHYFNSRALCLPLQASYRLEADIIRTFPGEKLKSFRNNRCGKIYMRCYNSKRHYTEEAKSPVKRVKRGRRPKVLQEHRNENGTQSMYAGSLMGDDDDNALTIADYTAATEAAIEAAAPPTGANATQVAINADSANAAVGAVMDEIKVEHMSDEETWTMAYD